jgi:predicted amidohydrolase YtcJ
MRKQIDGCDVAGHLLREPKPLHPRIHETRQQIDDHDAVEAADGDEEQNLGLSILETLPPGATHGCLVVHTWIFASTSYQYSPPVSNALAWTYRQLKSGDTFELAFLEQPKGQADAMHSANGAPSEVADSIVFRGKVYTLNPKQPWAEALAVRNGNIVAVGSNSDILSLRGSKTRIVDAAGNLVLPGFTDTHVHLSLEPSRGQYVEFTVFSFAELEEVLRNFRVSRREEPHLLAWALLGKEAAQATRRELDRSVSEVPVIIFDGHRGYANSRALDMAGITRDTPDPEGGLILRDTRGEPNGVLEEAAARLVRSRIVPEPTRKMALEGYRAAFRQASSLGLVRLHSAGYDVANIDLFDQLRREGELPLRLLITTVIQPTSLKPADLETAESARARYQDDWIDAGAVKFFQDGIVETHTAAMLEPYTDAANLTGETLWPYREFEHAVVVLNRRGFHILSHATGDRSVREILDAYEAARRNNGMSRYVLRIEHAEHISEADIVKFGRLGVMASMHPMFPLAMWSANEVCVGAHRMQGAYPWRTLRKAGGRVVFGSDFPAYSINPWEAIEILVAGHPVREERISLAEAIEGYTLGAAFAGGREATEGSLEVGKVADLIVLSQNLFEVPPAERIAQTKVMFTMVGGKVVHQLD